jgi:RHS repeat-associated protein
MPRRMTNQTTARIGSALGALLMLLFAGAALAHDFGGNTAPGTPEPDPKKPDCPCNGPDENGGGPGNPTPPPPSTTEKPISLYDGAKELNVTDLVVNGVFPIKIRRRYDSRSTYDSPLGYGWAFLHDRRLYEYPDNSVVVRYGSGTRDRYVYSGGGYVTPVGKMLAQLTEETDGSFRLKYLNGMVDAYDAQGRLTAVTDARGNRLEYTYDTRGKLPLVGSSKQAISTTQPMTVASNYRLTRIDARAANGTLTGRYVTFAYDETTGRLTSASADDGRTVTYEHDVTLGLTQGNLTQVNGLEGIVATYGYADPLDSHNLTSIVSAVGRTPIVNTFDDQDRVIRQEEGTRRMDIVYNVAYTRTTVTRTIKDQNGLNPYTAASVYEFDTTGRVTKNTDALGHERRYTYNAAKHLSRQELWQKEGVTLSLLQAMDWTYDANGNKLTETVVLDSGETITRSWSYQQNWVASEQVVSSALPGKVFRTEYTFHYGGDGKPTNVASEKRRKDDGSFQTTSYTYDSRNRLLTTTLPDGIQRVNEYTGDYVTRTYFVVGGSEIPQMQRAFEYDGEGNLIKEWDARNNLTQYGYDDKGRRTSSTNALGEQVINSYSQERLSQFEAGRTVAEGEGQVVRLMYDAMDRVIGIERKNDAGAWVMYQAFQLDSEGQRLSSTDAENRTTIINYDSLGRVSNTTDPAGKTTSFAYDAAGNRVTIIDALGRQTKYEYDDMNRVTAMVELGVSPNPRTEYGYDAAGNLVTVKDPENHTTTYALDALSRNTRVTQPMGQYVQYVYDTRDRVDFIINARGNKIDYDYESWGPVSSEREYPTTSAPTADRTIIYSRDNDGHVLSVADTDIAASPAYSMTYDPLGRPYDEVVRYIPGGDRTLKRRYDRYGNRKELTVLDGGALTNTYTYNKLNQLNAANLAGAALGLAYFANGDRQSITLPNGTSEQFAYRLNGPIQSITVNGPSGQIAQFAYTYTDVLNVDTQTDQHGTHQFGYDGLNRLTQTVRPSSSGLPNESYVYDSVGNREDPGNSALYGYDNNNRITASPGLTYTFDADGSMLTRSDGAVFTHDPRNRLRQFAKGTASASYLYEAGGRRVSKTVNGTSMWFLWDDSSLLAEYDGGGTPTKRYGYLPDRYAPLQVQDVNGTYYVHADHLQTPRLVTGSAAQTVWRSRHSAFGEAIVDEDVDGNSVNVLLHVRFPGQYFDAESELHYNYYRDYDPSTGRYVQSDPTGLAGGVNTFAYAHSRPTLGIDPFGLFTLTTEVSWGMADNIGGWWNFGQLGGTNAKVTTRCSCTQQCEGGWKLAECSGQFQIEVLIRNDLRPDVERWVRRKEQEHVDDLLAGAGRMRQAGATAEAALRKQTFSSKDSCESQSQAAVAAAVIAVARQEWNRSKLRDSNGSHSYPGIWPYK